MRLKKGIPRLTSSKVGVRKSLATLKQITQSRVLLKPPTTDPPTSFHLPTDHLPPTGRHQLTLKQKTRF